MDSKNSELNHPCKVYLDTNMIINDNYKKSDFKSTESVIFIHSVIHYYEFSLGRDKNVLETLNQIKSREIEINLDNKDNLTDDVFFHDYRDIKTYCEENIEKLQSDLKSLEVFYLLLAKMAGNKQIDHNKIVNTLKNSLPELINISSSLETIGHLCNIINSLGNYNFQSLKESRRYHFNNMISNLSPKKGPIMEQILDLMRNPKKTKSSDLNKNQSLYKAFNELVNNSQISRVQKVIILHSWLNLTGYRPDKNLDDEAKIPNITYDALHIVHASFCDVFLSSDRYLYYKATEIYNFLNIPTRVEYINLNKL